MRRLALGAAAATSLLFAATAARAEGTAQLGANQEVHEDTPVEVDILNIGEVINITVGNDSAADPTAVEVRVYDPSNAEVTGSPFTVGPGQPGWLQQPDVVPVLGDITNPLRIVTTQTGVYKIEFENLLTSATATGEPGEDHDYLDPFDITVTPTAGTPVDPANPPGGYGRVHSTRWSLNGNTFGASGATNAEFFVLVPTGTNSDYTWLLKFEGLAGYKYDVAGNDIGLPSPHSGLSEDESIASRADPMYDIYLNVPEVARGGSDVPVISNFVYHGPDQPLCDCSIAGLQSTFTFDSNIAGVYEIIIDVNDDGAFDPAAGDILLKDVAESGSNTVTWDGNHEDGSPVLAGDGTIRARLSVRLGEFHFVARDVETSRPGLRIFGLERAGNLPPLPTTTPSPTVMFWDDSRINARVSEIHPDSCPPPPDPPVPDPCPNPNPPAIPASYQSVPESTIAMGGLPTGDYSDPAACGADPTTITPNAHCWGDTSAPGNPQTPGNFRYVDTYVFFTESEHAEIEVCVYDANGDEDDDGVSNLAECTGTTDPTNEDSDGDCIPDGVEDANGNGVLDPGETDPNIADTDGDGIPDGVEVGMDPNNGCAPIDNHNPTDPLDTDSDGDCILDGDEDTNGNGVLDAGETNPANPDTDGDGIPDGVEVGMDPDRSCASIDNHNATDPGNDDSDSDGLPDGVEDANHDGTVDTGETDANDPDTDDDGLLDGVEDANHDGVLDSDETDPLDPDTDGDGLSDGVEDANQNGVRDPTETDPNDDDTDDDGLIDGIEQGIDRDGNAISGANTTDPLNPDTDSDGLPDGTEDTNLNGIVDAGETNANNDDTDDDGINDGVEDANQNGVKDPTETDPTNADTDDDGLGDGEEDTNQNGVWDEETETDANNDDTDDDGLIDGIELGVDRQGNAISDQNARATDPLNPDSDADGLTDGREDANHNGIYERERGETDPNDVDTDDDGLVDGIELGTDANRNAIEGANQTDPTEADSDGDGILDGFEDTNKNGKFDPDETNPQDADTDNDDLEDGREDENHNGIYEPGRGETDPRDWDTDDGGEPDGSEVLLTKHNPHDPRDDRPPYLALYGGGCACEVGPSPSPAPGALGMLLGLLLLGARRVGRTSRRRRDTGARS